MTRLHTDSVNGIRLQIMDSEGSLTVPHVFSELKNNFYGLEDITLSKEDCIIDIGANLGMFSIYAKKKFGCRIIAFEPVPQNFENFKANILLNGFSLEDFELHNTAITDVEDGTITICTPQHNTGGSSTFLNSGIPNECKTETVSKYITSDCKYLKIDCEGGEYAIIPTILDKLNQFEYIGIEYHKYNETQNASKLQKLILDNFRGKIYNSDPNTSLH
jgi:FkbM family methyltransferase